MNKIIKELGEEQRIALARVVSDLVRADKVIDDGEIAKFNEMFGRNNYKREIFLKAQQLSLSEALKLLAQPLDSEADPPTLKDSKLRLRRAHAKTTFNAVKDTAVGDGICDPTEAYLIIAVKYFLLDNQEKDKNVFSLKMRDFFMGQRFVIYVETENGGASKLKINECIKENYRIISHLLASIGYQFLYIPEIKTLYESKGIENFKDTAMYLFPNIPEEKVTEAYRKICSMTTVEFVRNYLVGKLGLAINNIKPSFLFMFGNSEVVSKDPVEGLKTRKYADFLSVEIKDCNPRETIDRYISEFTDIVSYTQFLNFNPRHDRLEYQGVFKLFFNLVARPEESVNALSINIKSSIGKIFVNDTMLDLSKRLTSLYLLIIITSVAGNHHGVPNLPKDDPNARDSVYDILFRKIYGYMGGKLQKLKGSIFGRLSQSIWEINTEFECSVKNFEPLLRFGTKNSKPNQFVTKLIADDIRIDGCKLLESDLLKMLTELDTLNA